MKRIFLIAFVVLAFVGISSAQTARIAAWNIAGFETIQSPKRERLARALSKLRPHIVLLTEVNPDSVASEIANNMSGYQSLILPQPANQNIAIIFKDSVSVANPRFIIGSDDGNQFLRLALAADIKIGSFDFLLIGVHMKASRPENLSDPDDPHNVRNRQAAAIAEFIRNETAGPQKDVLLVGDYNMIPGEDNRNFRTMSPDSGANEFLRYISTEALAGQVSHISGCQNGRAKGNLLDGFAISKKFTKEYIEASLIIIKPNDAIFTTGAPLTCSKYKTSFSDHLPLFARFRTGSDPN